jgi:zinc transport system permease protein
MNETGMTVGQFFDAWPLLGDAVLAGTIAGVVLGFLGVYVVLRRMVFLTAALSQSAGLGVALAFWVSLATGHAAVGHSGGLGEATDAASVSPTLGAVVVTLGAVMLLMADRSFGGHRRDALLGLIFLGSSAGTLLVGTRIVQEVQDIESLLFGTAVAVLPRHLWLLVIVGVVLAVVHLWWWRGFLAVTADPDGAKVRGMPTLVLEIALLAGLAVAVSATTRVLGALPAFAFSVLPALAAIRLAPNVPRALWIAAVLGGVCGFGGYLVATLWDLPVGPSQTAVGVVLAVVVTGGAEVVRLIRR